jgi:hypothetical protein
MSEILRNSYRSSRAGKALSNIFRSRRERQQQFSKDDWRSELEPVGQKEIPWVDDAVGLWPLHELRSGLTGYSGPGDIGDLSRMSELELAEE